MQITLANYNTASSSDVVRVGSSVLLLKGELSELGSDVAVARQLQVLVNKEERGAPHYVARVDKGLSFTVTLSLSPGLNVVEFLAPGEIGVIKELQVFFEKGNEEEERYSVFPLLICLTPVEEEEDADLMKQKIVLGLSILQAFFEEKLREKGYEGRTFHLFPGEVEEVLLLQNVGEGPIPIEEVWERVACLIRMKEEIWNPKLKYVGFLIEGEGQVPLQEGVRGACGGGGLAMMRRTPFSIWPAKAEDIWSTLMDAGGLDEEQTKVAKLFGCSEMTTRDLYSASMGALAHELGHVFGLGHETEGLMGKGFVEIGKFLWSVGCCDVTENGARILFYNRWFSEKSSEDGESEGNFILSVRRDKITSVNPLAVVEVRDLQNEMVHHSVLPGPDCREITLEKRNIPVECGDIAQIFAQDCSGNTMKSRIHRAQLRNSFTALRTDK